MPQFIVTALLTACLLLSGCGGYLQEEAAPAPQDCPVVGLVLDDRAQPIDSASVAVQLDRTYETTTDDLGRWRLVLPASYVYPARFAGTATKDGYLPEAIVFELSSACPLTVDRHVQLRQLTESDVLFSSAAGVTHLGDDQFEGDINSQLQLPSIGLKWSDGFTYTDAMAAKYTRLCVSFLARGVQSIRRNTISVSRAADPAQTEIQLMSDTDPSGGYTKASYCFSLAPFAADDRVEVTIESGNGDMALTDHDDFEFVSVVGSLLP